MGNRHASELTQEQAGAFPCPHFSRDQIIEIYRHFRKDFPQGFITREVFTKSYSRYYQSEADATFCNQLFNAYDTDGSNRVDFREFLVGLGTAMHGSTEQKLDWAFRMFNLDRDAFLTEDEISKVLKAIYTLKQVDNASDMASSQAKTIMKKLDGDKDGKLTKEEFLKAPLEYPYLVKIIETI